MGLLRRVCGHMPVELIFGAEGLGAVGLRTVERFLSRVTECVESELLLRAEDQTLVPTCTLLLLRLPLYLVLSLSLRPHLSWTSKEFGGGSSFLVLRRQCGNVAVGIGGSCCHGSPRVPLPLKLGRGCPAFQALLGFHLGVGFKGVCA